MLPAIDFARIFRAIGVRGGIAIALGLALAFTMWRADAISESREKVRKALVTEEAKHAITRQSLDTLEAELAGFVREGELRAARLDDAMSQVAIDTLPLEAAADKIEREGLSDDYVRELQEAGL